MFVIDDAAPADGILAAVVGISACPVGGFSNSTCHRGAEKGPTNR